MVGCELRSLVYLGRMSNQMSQCITTKNSYIQLVPSVLTDGSEGFRVWVEGVHVALVGALATNEAH